MADRRIVLAMSGGVDSSVAALLLREAGWDVTGLFMRTGSHGEGQTRSCCSLQDSHDARRVADRLGIPFYALNFEAEFGRIVDHFVDEYGRGRTPNPCVLCNRDLKFGKLYDYAAATGATHVATGHYGAVVERDGRFGVRRARDAAKDQSYVLFPLSQAQLARTVLPLGDLTKPEIRDLARRGGLAVSEKPESQEICFVPAGGYRELLARRGVATPGPILDRDGREIGRHAGLEFFTVGQRRGLGLAGGEPRYVTAVEPETGAVRVGAREDLACAALVADGWVAGVRPAPAPGKSYRAAAQIRYRHRAAAATVIGEPDGDVRVEFDEPQDAVAPGQAVVAYVDGVVAGGGWIRRARAVRES